MSREGVEALSIPYSALGKRYRRPFDVDLFWRKLLVKSLFMSDHQSQSVEWQKSLDVFMQHRCGGGEFVQGSWH